MTKKTVTVYTSLPTGLVLRLASGPVTLKGGSQPNPGIDADELENWLVEKAAYPPVQAGTIWSEPEQEAAPVPEPDPEPQFVSADHQPDVADQKDPLDHDGDGHKGGSKKKTK